jgi:hypothetical protein
MICPVCNLNAGDTPSGRCTSCVLATAAQVWQATNSPVLLSVTVSPQRVEEPAAGDLCPGCTARPQLASGLCSMCEVTDAVARYASSRVEERKRLWDRRLVLEGAVA